MSGYKGQAWYSNRFYSTDNKKTASDDTEGDKDKPQTAKEQTYVLNSISLS